MICHLNKIENGKPAEYRLSVDECTCGDPAAPIQVHDGELVVVVRDHQTGYHLQYELKANIETPCTSCGQAMAFVVSSHGGLGLTLDQPDSGHIVLKPSELDVRFLKEPQLDLQQFFEEQVELEIPQFPRHETGSCTIQHANLLESEGDSDSVKSSPFSVLNDMLKPENGSQH